MPDPATLTLFFGATLVLTAMAGPGLFYIAGRTLASGRADSLASCLGSALGGCVHVLAGAAGVSALVMASATAFTVLKLTGGLYLIYLGVQTSRSAGAADISSSGGSTGPDARRAFRQGVVVKATNLKTAALRGQPGSKAHIVRRLRQGSGTILGGLGISLLLTRRSV